MNNSRLEHQTAIFVFYRQAGRGGQKVADAFKQKKKTLFVGHRER